VSATSLQADQVKQFAVALGFDLCGITTADIAAQSDYYRKWLEKEHHGEMQWLARDPLRRSDPRMVLYGARSVICVALNYYHPRSDHPGRGRIASYALGRDYHLLFEEKLAAFREWLTQQAGGQHKVYVDTGPLLEKSLAARAGITWQAKSTINIHPKFGTWLFLGEILTTLELSPDRPANDHCGTCSRCIDACPTQAITAPYQLDARRCIAYLTLELKGSIPLELRPLIGDKIYGCDDCLEVCPWNRFAKTSRETTLAPTEATNRDLRDYLSLTREQFKNLFSESPILRIKRRGFLRNVCVALGNIGTADDLPALHRLHNDEEPLIREHAAWAIEQIEKRLTPKDKHSIFPFFPNFADS
jgi:epoxyqueuosine reductase